MRKKEIEVTTIQPKKSHVSTGCNDERRCCCGALLARVVANGIEIKCRRCRHFCLVPFERVQIENAKGQTFDPKQFFLLGSDCIEQDK